MIFGGEKITDYQVDGTAREKPCDNESPISHLAVADPAKVWPSNKIMDMIEKDGHKFWSYVYKDGKIIEHTKIAVEVIHDEDKGDYLRTRKDPTEENNLLELPIWHFKDKWERC